MSISLIQACNVQPTVSAQNTVASTRGSESVHRNIGQDTVSFSEEAIRLGQECSSTSTSGIEKTRSKPLEHYQLPDWIEEVSTPYLVVNHKLLERSEPIPTGANEYGSAVMKAFRTALDKNGINSDNYYDDFIMNQEMSMKVKNDVCTLLQQDSNAMQLMKIYNPSLYQKLA